MVARYGEGGIRTPDRAFRPYNGLANRRLQPLGHLSRVATLQFTLSAAIPPAGWCHGFHIFSPVRGPKLTAPAPKNNDGRSPRGSPGRPLCPSRVLPISIDRHVQVPRVIPQDVIVTVAVNV